ncbi:MAG: LPS assembly lipoprotein LptE [Thermodesulfobacteriota bacterium]
MKDDVFRDTGGVKRGRGSWTVCLFVLFIISLSGALSGCGYHIAGKGGSMPGGVTTLSIPFFQNHTQRPDVETVLTTAIVDEFINTASLQVVKGGEGEATLLGEIHTYTLTPVSFDSTDVTQEYRLSIEVDLKLVRRSDEGILWERKGLTDYEDFKVTALDVDATKAAEREALEKMAKDMARLIKEQMVEDF